MQLLINQILEKVKQNKKYRTISDEIVLDEIQNYLKKNPNESVNDLMIKSIRKNLHRLYSSYSRGKKHKKNKLLEELRKNQNDLEIIKKILGTVVSAKERLYEYEKIYSEIFKITGKPATILDLGCGLNPISFPFMNLKKLDYYAYDIDEEDIQFLNEYFKLMKSKGLNGRAQILNVRDFEKISKLPSSDLIFLLKIIDLIDINNHKSSEELIKILIKKTRFIVASFATRTISGKPMNLPRRRGFEFMLKRIGLKFETFSIKNEVFYVISK
ncbi:MAG: hypothetical protein PHF67_00710 [Candidatus Nanoarchaeia archaeon]|nr:hypothetical protein [Candidatus Nanoarchaeia archaeon]